MRFTHYARHPQLPALEAWKAGRGFWSFLILRERVPGARFVCSYRDQRKPMGEDKASCAAILFCNECEVAGKDAPPGFGYVSIDEATRACEQKFRELLRR